MHACVSSEVPFVLAGSIRDEGPLPDTITDSIAAQAAFTRAVERADLILALSAGAFGQAAADMAAASVRIVSVGSGAASELSERSGAEPTSIVTDVGLFLSLLARRLCGEG